VHGKKVAREISGWVCSPAATAPKFNLLFVYFLNILTMERLASGRSTDVKYLDRVITVDRQGVIELPRINGLHKQAIDPLEDLLPRILLTKPSRWITPNRHILKPG
jgi:hypothetical protein